MIILGSPFAFSPGTMLSIIQGLGLTSGLQLCLDAGDGDSYTSGQTWTDRSGNAYDFFRGSTSSSQSTDPTFNGTPGGQSSAEYWSFDGGDYFTLGQSNPTWVNNIHKNNATVTFAAWVYVGAIGSAQYLSGDFNPASNPMFEWYIRATTGQLSFAVGDGSGSAIYNPHSTATVSAGGWAFVAISIDEAGDSCVMQINATQESTTCTYPGPSSANAANTIKIGADGDGVGPLSNGSRLANFAAWSTSLSAASLLSLYNATKGVFGL